MKPAPFKKLAVLGLGLLGGSVALAVKERGLAETVVGAARRRGPLEQALEAGVIDAIESPMEAVAGADFVVLAMPVGSMARVLSEVSPNLESGSIVTDVGSVKGIVVDQLPGLLPAGVDFVGSHPMAGSHLRGPQYARADLFEGATCVVTPRGAKDDRATLRVKEFWRSLGACVTSRTPAEHDDDVAWVSHLPHLLSFAFAQSLSAAPERVGELAGSGFNDFTRIAKSDAELWSEILSLNSKALSGALGHFSESLSEVARILEEGDAESLEHWLHQARTSLAAVAAKGAAVRAGSSSKMNKE
ncbi:MAG: prephenate dehydrogenase/arogenate dehydrogenase family protein [Myxococcota bacterium]